MNRARGLRAISRTLIVVSVAIGIVGTFAATASAGCNPGRTDNFQVALGYGWQREPPACCWTLVSADIDSQDPYVKPEPNVGRAANTSYVWIMMLSSDKSQYAQYGPIKANDQNRYNLVECQTNSGGLTNFFDSPSPAGSQPTYQIRNSTNDGKKFWINGTNMHNCPDATFGANHIQAMDETKTDADQFPGDTSNHDNFDNMFADHSNSSYDFLTFGGYVYQQNGAGLGNQVSFNFTTDRHMETWDSYC
jgi:hypothetical protein